MPATFQTWICLRLKRKRRGKIHPYFFFSHVHKVHINCTSIVPQLYFSFPHRAVEIQIHGDLIVLFENYWRFPIQYNKTIAVTFEGYFEAILPFVCGGVLFRLIWNNRPFKPFSNRFFNRFSAVFFLLKSDMPPPFSRRFPWI